MWPLLCFADTHSSVVGLGPGRGAIWIGHDAHNLSWPWLMVKASFVPERISTLLGQFVQGLECRLVLQAFG